MKTNHLDSKKVQIPLSCPKSYLICQGNQSWWILFFFNVVTFTQLRTGNDKAANQQSNVISPEWSQPVVYARHSNLNPLSLRCHFVRDRCSDLSLFCASFGPSSVSYNTHCHGPHRNTVYHGSTLEALNYRPLGHICLQPGNRTTQWMCLRCWSLTQHVLWPWSNSYVKMWRSLLA